MRKVSPVPSTSATTWCAANCSPRSAAASRAISARRVHPVPSGEQPRDHAVGGPGLRQLSRRVLPDELSAGRSSGRMDHAAYRDSSAPHRGGGGKHVRFGDRRGARGAGRRRGGRAIDRPDRARHLHSDDAFPAAAVSCRPASASPRCRLRFAGGVLGLVFVLATADDVLKTALLEPALVIGAGDFLAHPRLGRPHDLRAVRRRRRGGRTGTPSQRMPGGTRRSRHTHSTHLHSDGRQHDQFLCRRRPVVDRHRRATFAWRARGTSSHAVRCTSPTCRARRLRRTA